jgi:hypothetical protein
VEKALLSQDAQNNGITLILFGEESKNIKVLYNA